MPLFLLSLFGIGCAPKEDDTSVVGNDSNADTGSIDTGSDDTGTNSNIASENTNVYCDLDADGYYALVQVLKGQKFPDDEYLTSAPSNPLDCDDTNASVHPTEEDIPGDGIDQDCDGVDATVDVCEGTTGIKFDETRAVSVAMTGGNLISGVRVDDVTGDKVPDIIYGSTADGYGEITVLSGALLAAGSTSEQATIVTVRGDSLGAFGAFFDVYDIDGDGTSDILISDVSRNDSRSQLPSGSAYLFLGGATLSGTLSPASAHATILGQPNEMFGSFLKVIGDIDGDGYPETLNPETSAQATFFIKSGLEKIAVGGTFTSDEVFTERTYIDNNDPNPFGAVTHMYSTKSFDLNNDGRIDVLAVGDSEKDYGRGGLDEIYFNGTLPAYLDLYDPQNVTALTYLGAEVGAWTGASFTYADIDGDGVPERIIPSPGQDERQGAVHVINGHDINAMAFQGPDNKITLAGDVHSGDGYALPDVGGVTINDNNTATTILGDTVGAGRDEVCGFSVILASQNLSETVVIQVPSSVRSEQYITSQNQKIPFNPNLAVGDAVALTNFGSGVLSAVLANTEEIRIIPGERM